MKHLLCLLLLATACNHAAHDVVRDTFPEDQALIRARLDDIWAAGRARDLDRLASFHLYGPKFTEFKEGAPRRDAEAGRAGERAAFQMLVDPKVDMNDLKIDVFGDVAVVTFNGDFHATIQDHPVELKQGSTLVFVKVAGDWKIAHEHFSLQGEPPAHG